MDHLRLDGMPDRLFACTPTRLMTFADCPRRYRMTYLERPPPRPGPPWAHTSLGVSVHNALRAWWEEPRPLRTPAQAGRLVVHGWIEAGFRDAEQSARWRERAREMVERYVDGLDPDRPPRALERRVAARTARLAVSGRVDRLDERDGALVVVDYKTGRRPLGVDDARSSLALALYAVAAARTLRLPCRRVELHHLPTGRVLAWEHTEGTLARHVARAEAIAADAVAATDALRARASPDVAFPPRPGPLCPWCDLRRHCPEGQAAGPARRPWDGLECVPGDLDGDPASDPAPVC